MTASMHRTIKVALATVWLVTIQSPAWAQYSIPSEAASPARSGSARQKIHKEIVREQGWDIGASLNFLTSDESLGGEDLKFTDLVLLRVHGLISLGRRMEIFAGADFLPKQPSYTDELEWQGGLAGGRVALGEDFAVWLRASGGPQLADSGWWMAADTAAQYKLELEKVLFFEAQLGWAHTQMFFDEDPGEAVWLDEVFTQFGIALRDKGGHFGAWINFDYYYPVLSNPDALLDPQPRVNFHLGGLVGVSETVDLFVEWSILDRGDLEDPTTILPLLRGGFDQKQLLFGFMRRFGSRARK